MGTLEKEKINGNGKGHLTNVKNLRGRDGKHITILGKPIITEETIAEIKTDVNTQEIVVLEPLKKELTLDQKIEKVENLKILIEKREKLEESRKKLSSFVVGSHQFSEKIVLSDDRGNSFNTSNSEVFAKVVATINETLVTKISEIEKQIEF
jgi:hypothetical protein